MGKFQVKVLQTLEQTAKETGMEEYREDKLEEVCCQSDKSTRHRQQWMNCKTYLNRHADPRSHKRGQPGMRRGTNRLHGGHQVLQPREKNKSQKISTYEIEQRNTGAARRGIPSSKSRVHCGYLAGKNKLWKEFCNLTSATNPWNAIYKMAGKTKKPHK